MTTFARDNVAEDETLTLQDFVLGFGSQCSNGAGVPVNAANLNRFLRKISECLVQAGTVKWWYGEQANIPSGWALCDGNNGTPDLIGKFIIGASGEAGTTATYPLGLDGGSLSATTGLSGVHNHGGTTGGTALTIAQMPQHAHDIDDPEHEHSIRIPESATDVQFDTGDNTELLTTASDIQTNRAATGITIRVEGGGDAHDHPIADSGAHVHAIDNALPPYKALFPIIKLEVVFDV